MSLKLLSEPIRKYIREKRWTSLRPIQNAAILRILTTKKHYILASRTASGKTEAAFLPILSSVDFNERGVQVLYISPLVALINDQFNRVEDLCQNLDVTVTKWHGEAKQSLKKRLVRQPSGIVLITPESLEAMFVNKPYQIKDLFSNLKFVVIDEIHSFIGTDRGIQLKSILSRLQAIHQDSYRIIGLSATLGDTEAAKNFTGDASNTVVLVDKTPKPVHVAFKFFKQEGTNLPLDLLKDLYVTTKDHKALIFPNSRGRVEEVAVKLKKISNRVNGHANYFSHHSSVHKEVREYIEFFAKNNRQENFCIACTSTLELGIDIGTVDEVIQIDATHSVASLIQRVGRSGRKDGKKGSLFLYATNPWSLLQSLACWQLHQENLIEPPNVTDKPYDILVHQALSIVKGQSGVLIPQLVQALLSNAAFEAIQADEIQEIITHLVKQDSLEQLRNEVIIGIDGEKIVNKRDFYSVFSTEETLKFIHSGRTIGEIPFSTQIREGENILLAARIWKIDYIDFKAKKVLIIPAKDGKKPMFSGGAGEVATLIREKMFDIVLDDSDFDYLNEEGQEEIRNMRNDFSIFNIENPTHQRPLLETSKGLKLFTFTGTRTNRAIGLLLKLADIEYNLDDKQSQFELSVSKQEFLQKWSTITAPLQNIDKHIEAILEKNPLLVSSFSKWGRLLPIKYQIKLIKQRLYDIESAKRFFDKVILMPNK